MLCYENQSISKLTFYLLNTRHLPNSIQVLRQKHIRQPNYQIDLRIVGTSHALSIVTPFSALTEVVVCSTIDRTQAPTLNIKRLCESEGAAACLTDMQYSIDWEIQQFNQDAFLRQTHRLRQRKEKDQVFSYEFPTRSSDVERPPLTLIEYECHPKRIQIQTHHTYPDEFGLVVTRTQIELR